jgi:small GTP-binding protein
MAQILQLKLVLLGDEAVGKTSLLNKWTSNSFDAVLSPTIGGCAQTKRDQIRGQTYCFQIWDTAGAERVPFRFSLQYRALTPLYARDSKAALIVFDLTSRKSFESLPSWVQFLKQQGDVPFVILGNKEDLTNLVQITSEEAVAYAQSVDAKFFTTSAKTGSNVQLAFRQAEIDALEAYTGNIASSPPSVDLGGRGGDAACC